MKKLLFILVMAAFSKTLSAQLFKVGDINCNHAVINHTFTTSCPLSISNDSQVYGFDIDGDLINDITFNSWCFKSGSSSAGSGNGFDVSASAGIEFAQNIIPNTGLENLAYGSPINAHSTWGTIGIIYRYVFSFTNNILIGQQVNPFYVGFRKILSNDTIYGWIQTNSILPGQILSYAYKNGAYCTGIDEANLQVRPVLIFPNPSNGEFEIKVDKEMNIRIANELGQIVKTVDLDSGNNFRVKISDLHSGVYFIGNSNTRHKVVVIK